LLEPGRVASEPPRPGIEHGLEPDLLRVHGEPDGIERALDHGAQIDRPHVETHLAHDDAGGIEPPINCTRALAFRSMASSARAEATSF
jgi:hypothetical protein